MNIGVDQSTPNNDLKKTKDGKYIYRLPDGSFDVDRFNRNFDQYKDRRKVIMKAQMDERLAELNKPPPTIPIWNRPIGTILIEMKDAMFGIIDDLLSYNFNINIFTKDNRLFYLGLFLLLSIIIVFILGLLVNLDSELPKKEKIIKHYYYYNNSTGTIDKQLQPIPSKPNSSNSKDIPDSKLSKPKSSSPVEIPEGYQKIFKLSK